MLNHIAIDGFRSLIGFNVFLQRGLNIIVGPNGTGKSNFITFLDFLGEMVEHDLNSAIAIAQGAGSVFSKERFDEEKAEFTFSITGQMSTEALRGRVYFYNDNNINDSEIDYTYKCTITYLKAVPAIFISYESINIKSNQKSEYTFYRMTERVSGKFVTTCRIDPERHPIARNMMPWDDDVKRGKVSALEKIAASLRPEKSVLSSLRSVGAEIAAISLDLSRFRSVNIDPTIARRPTPVGSRTQISPVGEGLAGALYSLEKGNYFSFDPFKHSQRIYSPDDQKSIYSNIVSWCREVNASIDEIRVDLDFQEAQFKPAMSFHIGDTTEAFPFNRVSDGTVKWLGLVTVLHTEEALSIIEEPENFLHPFMQESFISLCRQIVEGDPYRALIVTTHSPTVLDCCSAYELTIFELDDGLSRASRVSNRKELSEKIKDSKFGLGYYYRTGGVYGEDSGFGGGAHRNSFYEGDLS